MTSPADQPVPSPASSLLRSGFAILICRVLWAVSVFVTVPVILVGLGPEGFGVWESLIAVGAVATVLQTVLGGTVLWRMAVHFGEGRLDEARRLARVAITTSLLLAAASTGLVWAARGPLVRTLSVDGSFAADAARLLPLSVCLVLLGGMNQTLLSLLSGFQRPGISAMIQNAGLIVANGATIVAVWSGAGLASLAWGLLAALLVTFLFAYPAASHACGGLSLVPVLPSRGDLRILGPFAGLLLLSNLTVLFRDQVDKLVLAAAESSVSTAHFSLAQRLTSVVMQICVVMYVPLTSAVAMSHARGDRDRITTMYSAAVRWIGCLAGLVALLICVLRRPIFLLWLGHDLSQADRFLAPLLFGTTAAITLAGSGVALAKGIGRPGLETAYTLITLVLTVVSKPILVWCLGTWGAVLSSALSWFLGSCCLLGFLHRGVDLPRKLFHQTWSLLALTTALAALGWWGGTVIPVPRLRLESAAMIVIGGLVLGLTYGAILATLGYLPEARRIAVRCLTTIPTVLHWCFVRFRWSKPAASAATASSPAVQRQAWRSRDVSTPRTQPLSSIR